LNAAAGLAATGGLRFPYDSILIRANLHGALRRIRSSSTPQRRTWQRCRPPIFLCVRAQLTTFTHVRRVSIGGALARTAWTGFVKAATLLLEQGTFDGFADVMPHDSVDSVFRERG
jgi:hypothetical protein